MDETTETYWAVSRTRDGYGRRMVEIGRNAVAPVVPSLDPAALEPLYRAVKETLTFRLSDDRKFTNHIHGHREHNKLIAIKLQELESTNGTHGELETRRRKLQNYLRPIFEHNARFKDEEIKPETILSFGRFRPFAFFIRSYRSGRKAIKNYDGSDPDLIIDKKVIPDLSRFFNIQAQHIIGHLQELEKIERHLAEFNNIAKNHATDEQILELLRDKTWQTARRDSEFARQLNYTAGLSHLDSALAEIKNLAELIDETTDEMRSIRKGGSDLFWELRQ